MSNLKSKKEVFDDLLDSDNREDVIKNLKLLSEEHNVDPTTLATLLGAMTSLVVIGDFLKEEIKRDLAIIITNLKKEILKD